MKAVDQWDTAAPIPLPEKERRKVIGYFLRHCGNLHYFAAIKPFLDHYLHQPNVENRILVNRITPGLEKERDFRGYANLFTDRSSLADCDVVLTPTYLRPEDRPRLDRSKTRLVQIFHGMSDKPFTYERDFSDYDLCLCIGQRQLDRLRSHAHNRDINWSLIGYPKFETALPSVKPLDNGRKTVIYCPTWRKGGISSIDAFLDSPNTIRRIAARYDLIVKPHPNLLNADRPFFDQSIIDRLRDIPNITVVRDGNVMPWFARSDLFIGDVSATGYEWLYFDQPMVFLNPQPGVLRRSDNVESMTYLWRCGDVCDDIATLPEVIERNLQFDHHAREREKMLCYSVHRPRNKGATRRGIDQIDALLADGPKSKHAIGGDRKLGLHGLHAASPSKADGDEPGRFGDSVFDAIRHLRRSPTLVPVLGRLCKDWPIEHPWQIRSQLLYLNYKPFERARMVLSVRVTPPDADHTNQQPFTARISLEARADEKDWRTAEQRPGDNRPRAFAIDALNTRGWLLPDAPELRELALLQEPERLHESVGPALGWKSAPENVQLIRYVPRKRAILVIETHQRQSRLYAKLVCAKDANDVASCFGAIDRVARKGIFSFRVPRVLQYDPDLRTVFMSEIPGRPFTEEMHRAATRPFVAAGEALAELHRSDVRPAVRWPVEKQMDDLRRHLGGMGRVLPDLRSRIDDLIDRLTALGATFPDVAQAPIHGNLFGDQMLWDGKQLGIVDWDRLAIGDPLYDVGRLLAHYLYETRLVGVSPGTVRTCADALVGAYAHATGSEPDRRRLAWHVAVELLLRAKISALRPLAPDWAAHCAQAVADCERVLRGDCEALTLPALSQRAEIRQ